MLKFGFAHVRRAINTFGTHIFLQCFLASKAAVLCCHAMQLDSARFNLVQSGLVFNTFHFELSYFQVECNLLSLFTLALRPALKARPEPNRKRTGPDGKGWQIGRSDRKVAASSSTTVASTSTVTTRA